MKKLLSLAIVLISASLLRPQMVNVTSSGVGIGTSAPTVTLHVKTDTGVRIEEGTGGPRGLVIEPPDMNSSSNNAKIYTSGTALGMEFGVGGVTMMTLGGSGNVGIGTTTPARLLEIRSLLRPRLLCF